MKSGTLAITPEHASFVLNVIGPQVDAKKMRFGTKMMILYAKIIPNANPPHTPRRITMTEPSKEDFVLAQQTIFRGCTTREYETAHLDSRRVIEKVAKALAEARAEGERERKELKKQIFYLKTALNSTEEERYEVIMTLTQRIRELEGQKTCQHNNITTQVHHHTKISSFCDDCKVRLYPETEAIDELQREITRLKAENAELKKERRVSL